MSLISFLKEAGEKMMNRGGESNGSATTPSTASIDEGIDALSSGASGNSNGSEGVRDKEQALERAILDYMAAQGLPIENVTVHYQSDSATVHLTGSVPDQATREKMVLCCGNVQGVANVDDDLTVEASDGGQSSWYTVQSGDSLSKIAQDFYGDADKYDAIFEANQPMLSDPNRIYPGQTLRIPQQA